MHEEKTHLRLAVVPDANRTIPIISTRKERAMSRTLAVPKFTALPLHRYVSLPIAEFHARGCTEVVASRVKYLHLPI